MYVAVKGGARAIAASHACLAEDRRGDPAVPELSVAQVAGQLGFAVDRVMAEGALFDRDLAALAVKQAAGDLVEAAFLLRAYRTTLPRFGYAQPVDTGAMLLARRISATYKDLPGGQLLGPTHDYTHRLLDFALLAEGAPPPPAPRVATDGAAAPRVTELLAREGLMAREAEADTEPADLTRAPPAYPAERSARLQNLARGDEGFVLALGYSTQRGYGGSHPFVAEIRVGAVAVSIAPEELGFAVEIGDIDLTECQMVNQFAGSRTAPPQFTRGYGLAFGHNERKAMGMALVDRSLRARELGEDVVAPAQDEEFVLSHTDNVEASGFVQHLKLPHYVDFQSELELIRALRREAEARGAARPEAAE
jgi:alpha-D-ribose 1-methylphosphonate 5-triphosphate synthase subunit PhnI